MEQFYKYVSRFKSDFRTSKQGAIQEEVDELERYIKYPLPMLYKEFLYHMGKETGDFRISEGTSDIRTILAYYRECLESGDWDIPPNCILIAAGYSNTCLEYIGNAEPRVVFADDEVIGLYAETFEKLLYKQAFLMYRLRAYAHEAFYTSSYATIGRKHRVAEARNLALKLGFEEQWFSDAITFCGEQDSIAIAVNQYEEQGLAIIIRAKDIKIAAETGRHFEGEFGVKPA